MEIIKMIGIKEDDKRSIYKMTRGENVSLKNCVDAVINPQGIIEYHDVNAKEEEVDIVSILDKDGTVYAGQSSTFKRELYAIDDLFGIGEYQIKVIGGVTKAGRDYISCTLV